MLGYKISVIIPIYNSEKYLSNCINSILKQDYQDFEVILVNDGSTDGSLNICKQYIETDDRICLIDKLNSGVSDSRNVGILKSTGEYIFFCDSDDLLFEDCFSTLVKYAKEYNADLVGAGFRSFLSSNDKTLRISVSDNILCMNRSEALDTYGTTAKGPICSFVFPKIFSRKIIIDNNLFFRRDLFYKEDTVFSVSFIEKASRIVCVNKVIYQYRFHNNSATVRCLNFPETWRNRQNATNAILEVAKKYTNSNFIKEVYFDIFNQYIGELLAIYLQNCQDKNRISYLKQKIKEAYKCNNLPRLSNKQKLKFFLVMYSPALIRVVFFFYRIIKFNFVF